MRKFKLINGNGAELDLTDRAHFFHNVGGLGFARDIDGVQVGYDFIVTRDDPTQKKPNGDMVFQTYAGYQEFVAFCAVTPLVLAYMPISTWHYLDCKVEKLGKTEIDKKTRCLICPVDFLGLGTWYASKKIYQVASGEAEGKTYPYTYSYTYVELAAGSVEVNNTGAEPSPCIIHIFGEAVSPSWALIKNGLTVLTGKINATIVAGNKLVVSSVTARLELAEYTVNGVFVRNAYQDSDFSTARFIMVPPGRSTISFTHEATTALAAVVEVLQIADTV